MVIHESVAGHITRHKSHDVGLLAVVFGIFENCAASVCYDLLYLAWAPPLRTSCIPFTTTARKKRRAYIRSNRYRANQ